MATTYNPVLVGDIDISDTYTKLMMLSTGQDSVYIKAKETISDSLDTMVGLSDNERGKIIADAIVSIAKEMTNTCMQVAVKIETENRDAKYALTKMKEDTRRVTAEIAKAEKEIEIAEKNLWISTVNGWKVQAEVYRDYGVQTWGQLETTKVLPQSAFTDYGVKVEVLKKAKVDTYSAYANSYRQNGKVTYTTNPADGSFSTVTGDTAGLAYAQTSVAKRQEEGFDDNMRQHVVNSSASMIGMLLTTDAGDIDPTQYLDTWHNAARYLSGQASI